MRRTHDQNDIQSLRPRATTNSGKEGLKMRGRIFSVALHAVVIGTLLFAFKPRSLFAQSTQYTITQITSGSENHKWPALDSFANIVWSQQVNGLWQVYKNGAPIPVPDSSHNFSYPVIDDAGDVIYLKDTTGSGAGLEVILNVNGSESTIEYSSGNPPGCVPPNCSSWRSAGEHFGVSRTDGTIVSYHDFCATPSSCTRYFDVSGTGQLPGTFNGFDYPDINAQRVFAYSSNSLFTATLAFPGSATSLFAGIAARLGDTNEVAYVSGPSVVSSARGIVDDGVWVDVNNSGQVVYEKVVNGFSQVFLATPKMSTCGDARDTITTQYAPKAQGGVYQSGVIDINNSLLFTPVCADYTKGVSDPAKYFPYMKTCTVLYGGVNTPEPCGLDGGDYAYALVRRPLVIPAASGYGLDMWNSACMTQEGLTSRTITSAYRNPKHNAKAGGKPQSRHMFGDAVDLYNSSCATLACCGTPSSCSGAEEEWSAMIDAALIAGADYTEPLNLACKYECAHADWRSHNLYSGGSDDFIP
jgi:hypothetical protein